MYTHTHHPEHMYARTHADVHSDMHARTQSHTHTHTHKHTWMVSKQSPPPLPSPHPPTGTKTKLCFSLSGTNCDAVIVLPDLLLRLHNNLVQQNATQLAHCQTMELGHGSE